MLKKENRLAELNKTSLNKISTPFFNLGVSQNREDKNRFAFIVSKKIDKRAVIRNKTKRKVRSVVEEMFEKIKKGNDFIFYLKSGAVKAQREEILSQVRETFSKNKLLK